MAGMPRTTVLTICADPGNGVIRGAPSFLVCGREPNHWGDHKDIEWPAQWQNTDRPARPGKDDQ